MKKKVVGIGKHLVTGSVEENLCTYALGSCVALTLYFPAAQVAGMSHVVLPNSLVNINGKSRNGPAYYADTAVAALLASMQEAAGNRGYTSLFGLSAKLIGGATMLRVKSPFNIGINNVRALERQLAHHRIPISACEVGGNICRTVTIRAENGHVLVQSPATTSRIL